MTGPAGIRPSLVRPSLVRPSRLQLPASHGLWPDLLAFLVSHFPDYDESCWRERMLAGLVQKLDGSPLLPDAPFLPHQTIQYYRYNPHEPQIPGELTVLYRDERLIVVDKPHFLPTIPSGRYVMQTLIARLAAMFGDAMREVQPLHRLDAATAGIVVCCLQPTHRGLYQQLFAKRAVEKIYEAVVDTAHLPTTLVQGRQWQRESRIERAEQFFMSREIDGVPNARTRAELMLTDGPRSLLRLYADTGKKHQLRLHLAAAGMPICCDPLYGNHAIQDECTGEAGTLAADYSQPLQLLARQLSMTDPLTGQAHVFTSRRRLAWAPQVL